MEWNVVSPVYALILTKDAPFTATRYKLCLGRQIYYISASLKSVCTLYSGHWRKIT